MAGEAAWTQPDTNYPGFINFSRSDTPGHIKVIVRSPHQSNVSALDIPIEDWDQLIASAALVRQAVESELERIVADKHEAQMMDLTPIEPAEAPLGDTCSIVADLTEEMNDAVANGAANGATADDPLGQRADVAGADGSAGSTDPDAGSDWRSEIDDPAAR